MKNQTVSPVKSVTRRLVTYIKKKKKLQWRTKRGLLDGSSPRDTQISPTRSEAQLKQACWEQSIQTFITNWMIWQSVSIYSLRVTHGSLSMRSISWKRNMHNTRRWLRTSTVKDVGWEYNKLVHPKRLEHWDHGAGAAQRRSHPPTHRQHEGKLFHREMQSRTYRICSLEFMTKAAWV